MIYRLCLGFVLLFANPVLAQDTQAVLTVVGTGQVSAAPDMATISVGVEVEAPNADQALKLNGARMREIINTLKALKIAPRDIQTSQFSLYPQWSNPKSSSTKPPKITSFVATNVVFVRVRALESLGLTLDALTSSGANRIQGVEFGLTKPGPFLDKARRNAVVEARRKAALYADAAGVTLGVILSIDEGRAQTQPIYRAEARLLADSAPIAEGELDLTAEVTIRFAID
jgi:uncharacterized protein YggE